MRHFRLLRADAIHPDHQDDYEDSLVLRLRPEFAKAYSLFAELLPGHPKDLAQMPALQVPQPILVGRANPVLSQYCLAWS